MKRIIIAIAIALLLVGLGIAFADKPAEGTKGNGLPKGKSYNLNIIGIPKGELYSKELNDNFTGGNGKRIFVSRKGMTKIYVYGDDNTSYKVLDHNGTDGEVGGGVGDPGITFPYDENADTWQAQIWVRLVGPNDPENTLNWKISYWDGVSTWVLVDEFDLSKSSKFSVPSGGLLRDGYQDLLWELTPGNKFRILQMRIYLD